ncbi:MAG TPA: hypothetical protein VMV69_24325 [Pirellulales bacterium]|nr:hypothetical protein [Pirellulales bacterium]
MSLRWAVACLISMMALKAPADEYRVERLETPAPDGVAPAIAERLAPAGYKVMVGKRTICEVWPASQWPVAADFKSSSSVIYPFEMGQLIGVARYPRKGGDFRGRAIPKGVYIMRYGLQPQDGNHVGTSDTRDFLLLLSAADDTDPQPVDKPRLFKLSAKTSGTTHPAMLSLLAPPGEPGDLPAMIHHESRELWSLRFANPSQTGDKTAGDKTADLVVELVVVGKAAE